MKTQEKVRLDAVPKRIRSHALGMALTLGMATLANAQPTITLQPTDQFAAAGRTVTLRFTASSATPYTSQWFFDGAALPNATNTVFLLAGAQPSLNGDYFAILANDSGSVTTRVARVKVFVPAPHSIGNLQIQPGGAAALGLAGETTLALAMYYDLYPLQTSSNLVDWTPLTTLQRANTSVTPLTFLDTNAVGSQQRFYRTPTNLLVSPVPPLTGPYPVGAFSRLLTDPARTNGTGAYQFMVTVWYPASAGPGMVPVPYVDKAVAAFSTYYSSFTSVVPSFRSHSVTNVALATQEAAYPVLLYTGGWGHHRRDNTDKVEDLASWGYVVVGIDAQETPLSVFPDGTVRYGTSSGNASSDTNRRVRDEQFVMDELARWNTNDPLLTGRLDLDHIGAFGWSLGAVTAGELCLLDRRCKAGAGFDGGFGTNVLASPFETPFLFFRADQGPDPDPGANINNTDQMDDKFPSFNQATTNAYWVKLSSTIHQSFAEPSLIWDPTSFTNSFGVPSDGQLLPGPRVSQIVRAYLSAFFNKHLRGIDNHLLDGPSPDYPEVRQFLNKSGVSVGPEFPAAGLTPGSDGNFYGTTAYGGDHGMGTVFRVTPAGDLTTLVSFNGANGSHPLAALLPASDGNFYGTTADGGTNGDNGTVFQMTPAGALTTLASFQGANGRHPFGRLTQSSDGHFYGTTLLGGTNNEGSVFQMTAAGALTTLASFKFYVNGAFPVGALLEDSDGSFYGTTANGTSAYGGTLFKVTSAGQLTTVIVFTGANGWNPWAGLVRGADGNFYGTGEYGGNMSLNGGAGFGSVFKMTPAGVLKTLVAFNGANGNLCLGPLLQVSDGSFYGTTYAGGAGGGGTVFKMTPTGVLTTLIAFDGANGRDPQAPLVQGSDRNFYGTTEYGGPGGAGTVFQITSAGELKTLVAFGSRTHSP